MSTYTPLPWYHLSGGNITTTVGPQWAAHMVAQFDHEEDAAYAMHCIRSHTAMLEALKGIRSFIAKGELCLTPLRKEYRPAQETIFIELIEAMDAVIAQAEGKV